jgi:hypothetical protein
VIAEAIGAELGDGCDGERKIDDLLRSIRQRKPISPFVPAANMPASSRKRLLPLVSSSAGTPVSCLRGQRRS